jgi:hypothetical protein
MFSSEILIGNLIFCVKFDSGESQKTVPAVFSGNNNQRGCVFYGFFYYFLYFFLNNRSIFSIFLEKMLENGVFWACFLKKYLWQWVEYIIL